MARYVIVQVDGVPNAKAIGLTETQMTLIHHAVLACTRSGGGSVMNTLGMKLSDFHNKLPDLREVWMLQRDVHREVEEALRTKRRLLI